MEITFKVLKFVVVLLEAILIFNLLIVVHELGHFLAARWRGLVVEQFAVWFGKPLWKRTYNGVVYSLGSIPFGGFVKLPQMAPMDVIEGESDTPRDALPTISPLDKIIVAFAGPLFSLGLAFVFAMIVSVVGRPSSEADSTRYIGYVLPDSPASEAPCDIPGVPAGLRAGDEILKVDGHDVKRFGGMNGSVVWYVARSEGERIPFEVKRGEQTLTFEPKPLTQGRQSGWGRKALRQVLIEPAYSSIVKGVKPGSPAARAGLQENDIITQADGQKLWSVSAFADLETRTYGRALDLTVERGQETLHLSLPPMSLKIGDVTPHGPADLAGIKKGDSILAIDGAPVGKFTDLADAIRQEPAGQAMQFTVSTAGQERTVAITPELPKVAPDATEKEKAPKIGISRDDETDGIAWTAGGKTTPAYERPVDQIAGSVTSVINTVGAVIAPKSGIGLQHLGGPLFIAQTYFHLLSSDQGWQLALWFSVVLNVNLAMLNLLPIPVLDGGHILLACIEAVRRRPVNLRALEIIQTACFIVIVGYMLFVTRFDVGDMVSSGDKHRNVEFQSPHPVAPRK